MSTRAQSLDLLGNSTTDFWRIRHPKQAKVIGKEGTDVMRDSDPVVAPARENIEARQFLETLHLGTKLPHQVSTNLR